jgi:hypothetical protein
MLNKTNFVKSNLLKAEANIKTLMTKKLNTMIRKKVEHTDNRFLFTKRKSIIEGFLVKHECGCGEKESHKNLKSSFPRG